MTEAFTLRELEEAFHQSVTLGGADRMQFLERACGSRPGLRAQVERMIEADSRATGIDRALPEDTTAPECGQSIGRWKLIELIGAGGLGVVYRGSCEADGVTIQAAVKMLPAGLDLLLHERFIQERKLLAGLDHPYIARLIDAGAGPGGSFMAMEFVEGLPLDTYLEQRQPPLTDRLDLFHKICEAAAYLHDNGIVHGDLKPSNVMVRPEGIPKLLDFGTARLINDSRETRGSFTGLLMTPAYASPEQMAGMGPSARGDVYSLGCVLREMLGSEAIRFDLASIRDKCLGWSPDERYASPRQIAEDVVRFRRHFPVRARPASPLCTTLKFLRRNRIACGLAALAIVSLLTGGLVSRHNAVRASQYAEQRRSVISRLVRDETFQRSPESRQRAAYAAGVEDAAAQMERMHPPPAGDLTSAWRGVSYSQAARGLTPQGIMSIERSIRWGRLYVEKVGSADARSQLAESLLYAAFLHKRRANMAAAGRYALEAIQLVDSLPDSSRTAVEKTPVFVRALLPAAHQRALAGDSSGGRAILVRAAELGRAVDKSLQLQTTLDLVQWERSAREHVRVEAGCREALAIGITMPRLTRLCGPTADLTTADREGSLEREASVHDRRLLRDPERFGDRLQLARQNLQLARLARQRGDLAKARERLQRARALAEGLLKGDPESPRLRQLLANIERMTMRSGATGNAGSPANAARVSKKAVRAW